MCAAAQAMDPDDLKRKRVLLVVDDDVLVRLLVAEHLRDVGFTVLEAGNAHDAMAVIASQVTIDLVFSDINMPGNMDGYALANWLRVFSPQLPVILTSAAAKPFAFSNQSVRRFITKPYELLEVERQMREILSLPPDAGEAPA